jgi:hypothetical protein
MKRTKLGSLSSDELWALHQEVAATLASRLTAEMGTIENRLRNSMGLSGPGCLGKRLAADFIRRSPQNSGIRTSRRKLGQVGESNRAG